MWTLYNENFDFSNFISKHPGGDEILLKTKNVGDITALFETYHAFSDKENIKKILYKYKIENKVDNKKKYDFTNYNKLTDKIKKIFPNRKSIKAPIFFYIKNIILIACYVYFFSSSIFSKNNIYLKCLYSFIAGLLWIGLGFNIMHDGSHYAITEEPSYNLLVSKIWNSFSLWNGNIWFYHHVYNHHSFTNETNKDPDLYHYNPFAIKDKNIAKYKFFQKIQHYIISFITIVFPGMYIGQAISYYIGFLKKRLWRITLPNITYYSFFEIFLMIIQLLCLYKGLYAPTLVYIISNNLFYHINIVPDHDTYETHIENHYEGDDWLKLQICNSGNFLNDNMFWTNLFGGINYQIEHHLFPNMSHVYYPIIAPIVKKYCLENNIPYVHHETIFSAYKSFLKMIEYNSKI